MGEQGSAGTGAIRPIGFVADFLPNSTDTEFRTSFDGIVTPSYDPESLLYDQDPPPYSPNLSGNPDTPLYDVEPPPYPSKLIDENGTNLPPTKEFQQLIPSAPSVEQIEYRIGLIHNERDIILNALSKMRANALWKTEEEKRDFSVAEDEVLEILHSVESRLTNLDKEEFLVEVRKINQLRNDEGIRQSYFGDIGPGWCYDAVTIGFKMLEVAMSIVIFVNIKDPRRSLDRRLTLLFIELIGIISTCFLISYWCSPNRSRNIRILDSIFCVVSTIGCALAGCCATEHQTAIYIFWALVTYGLDTLWKLCQKDIRCD